MNLIRLLLGLCQHEHVSWPQKGRQRCLDCAMSRAYILGRVRQSKWEEDKVEQRAQDVFVLEEEG